MHKKFQVPRNDAPILLTNKYMMERLDFIFEELQETTAAHEDQDLDEVIDGLIDIIVVAAGTLDIMGVKGLLHWREVMAANMRKVSGKKPGRTLAHDVTKPEGWIGPNHEKVREHYNDD